MSNEASWDKHTHLWHVTSSRENSARTSICISCLKDALNFLRDYKLVAILNRYLWKTHHSNDRRGSMGSGSCSGSRNPFLFLGSNPFGHDISGRLYGSFSWVFFGTCGSLFLSNTNNLKIITKKNTLDHYIKRWVIQHKNLRIRQRAHSLTFLSIFYKIIVWYHNDVALIIS